VPLGISRIAVRGFAPSNSRSTIRLNAIAANRAAVNARITHPTMPGVSVPRRVASVTPTKANGSANTVCGSFTKLA